LFFFFLKLSVLCLLGLQLLFSLASYPPYRSYFLQKVLEDKKPFSSADLLINASNIVGHVDCCATTKLNVSSDNTSWEIFSSHRLK